MNSYVFLNCMTLILSIWLMYLMIVCRLPFFNVYNSGGSKSKDRTYIAKHNRKTTEKTKSFVFAKKPIYFDYKWYSVFDSQITQKLKIYLFIFPSYSGFFLFFQRCPVFTDTPYVTCWQTRGNLASTWICDISTQTGCLLVPVIHKCLWIS